MLGTSPGIPLTGLRNKRKYHARSDSGSVLLSNMVDVNNFWSNRSRVERDSPSVNLPPLDSNNFFTSNNFLSSLPSEAEDSNRSPAQSRRQVEVDGDEEVEDSNRIQVQLRRRTEVDEEQMDSGHSRVWNGPRHVEVDGIGDWEDSNRMRADSSLLPPPRRRQALVAVDGDSDHSDSIPVDQLHPSRAIRDTDDNTAGTLSGTFHYVHNEPPSQPLITDNSDNSFSVPSIDSRKQLKDKVVRKIETSSPLLDPLLHKSMKNPETETVASEEDSTERIESQSSESISHSVVTQETGEAPDDSILPSSDLHPSIGSHPPADCTVPNSSRDSEVNAASALSTNLASRSNPSTSIKRASQRVKGTQFGAIPTVQLSVTDVPSLPRQQKHLLPNDSSFGGSLPSRLQNRALGSSSFSASAPTSPSSPFLNESPQHMAHVKPSAGKVMADSPHLANARMQQLPVHGSNQRLSPGLLDLPEVLPTQSALPNYPFTPQRYVSECEFEQPQSLPGSINDGQYGVPVHHHDGYYHSNVGDRFSDFAAPMSLPASSNNFFSSQSGLPSLHTDSPMMSAHEFEYTGQSLVPQLAIAEPTAADETLNEVGCVSDGSEEFKTPLDSLGKVAKVCVESIGWVKSQLHSP